MPADPSYAGVVLHHQGLQVEFDQSLAITRLAGSNGLRLPIGSF